MPNTDKSSIRISKADLLVMQELLRTLQLGTATHSLMLDKLVNQVADFLANGSDGKQEGTKELGHIQNNTVGQEPVVSPLPINKESELGSHAEELYQPPKFGKYNTLREAADVTLKAQLPNAVTSFVPPNTPHVL